jgi:hypothetical protein
MSCGKATWCCYRTRLAAASPPASEPLALVASAIFALATPACLPLPALPHWGIPSTAAPLAAHYWLPNVCHCLGADGVPAPTPILLAPAMSRHSTDRPSRSFPPSRHSATPDRIHASTPHGGSRGMGLLVISSWVPVRRSVVLPPAWTLRCCFCRQSGSGSHLLRPRPPGLAARSSTPPVRLGFRYACSYMLAALQRGHLWTTTVPT